MEADGRQVFTIVGLTISIFAVNVLFAFALGYAMDLGHADMSLAYALMGAGILLLSFFFVTFLCGHLWARKLRRLFGSYGKRHF